MSDNVSKWVGIVSGVVTVVLAVPAISQMNPWLLGGALMAFVALAVSSYVYFRSEPYDVEFLNHEVELNIQDDAA